MSVRIKLSSVSVTPNAKIDFLRGESANLYVERNANGYQIKSYRDCLHPAFVSLKHYFKYMAGYSETKWSKENIEKVVKHKIELTEKFKRAVEKTIKIAGGAQNLVKKGFQPKLLSGEYWQEFLLPEHYSGQYLSFMQQSYLISGSKLPFEEWIKTPKGRENHSTFEELIEEVEHEPGYNSTEDFKVKYLNADERPRYALSFTKDENNVLLLRDGVIFTTSQDRSSDHKRAIFVMDESKMYVHFHKISQFHHSSFLAGGPAVSAGEIITDKDGHIVAITNKSGHYKPGKAQILTALQYLKDQGVNLSGVILSVLGKSEENKFDAEQYLSSAGHCPPLDVLPSDVADKLS